MRNSLYPTGRHPRTRLRKRRTSISSSPNHNSLRVKHIYHFNNKRNRDEGQIWGGLNKAWVGYVIAKSQDDYEKMRKYAVVIRKFERRLNIAINDFPEIGIQGFEEDFENKEEDDDSKLAVVDPWTNEVIRDAKEDDNYYSLSTK